MYRFTQNILKKWSFSNRLLFVQLLHVRSVHIYACKKNITHLYTLHTSVFSRQVCKCVQIICVKYTNIYICFHKLDQHLLVQRRNLLGRRCPPDPRWLREAPAPISSIQVHIDHEKTETCNLYRIVMLHITYWSWKNRNM